MMVFMSFILPLLSANDRLSLLMASDAFFDGLAISSRLARSAVPAMLPFTPAFAIIPVIVAASERLRPNA